MNRLKYIVMVLMIGNFMVAFPPSWPPEPQTGGVAHTITRPVVKPKLIRGSTEWIMQRALAHLRDEAGSVVYLTRRSVVKPPNPTQWPREWAGSMLRYAPYQFDNR